MKLWRKIFESRLFKYQIGLEKSMEGSNFVFDYVDLLYCKFQKTNPNYYGSCIASHDWVKNNKKHNNESYQ